MYGKVPSFWSRKQPGTIIADRIGWYDNTNYTPMWIPSTRAVESGVREGNTAAVYSQLATLDPGSSSRELQLRKRIHRGFQYGTSCDFVGFDEK